MIYTRRKPRAHLRWPNPFHPHLPPPPPPKKAFRAWHCRSSPCPVSTGSAKNIGYKQRIPKIISHLVCKMKSLEKLQLMTSPQLLDGQKLHLSTHSLLYKPLVYLAFMIFTLLILNYMLDHDSVMTHHRYVFKNSETIAHMRQHFKKSVHHK